MIKKILLILFSTVATQTVLAANPLTKKTIEYGTDTKFEGYFVGPKNPSKRTPGILLIHNWMGVSDETKKQAERFANLGYTVFAADIYGKGVRPKDAKEAGTQAGKFKGDRNLFRQRLQLGFEQLKKIQIENSSTAKIAVAGYCFGGTGAIELARAGTDIAGAISFHGGLDSPTPADGKNIKAKILALHGAIDPFVPANDLAAFEAEMQTNNIDYQLIKYGGAVHSFTEMSAGNDIKKGAAYNEAADRRSFATAEDFLKEIFTDSKK